VWDCPSEPFPVIARVAGTSRAKPIVVSPTGGT
jgi:hypothetical protein